MAIKYATEAKLDLLTIDGSGGGTGMSPWNMMENWGVPSILLHSKATNTRPCSRPGGKGRGSVLRRRPGPRGPHVQGLALGSPYVKMICMGRAVMIPGFLGPTSRAP